MLWHKKTPPKSPEQTLLQEMKIDEELLISYYQQSDICSDDWIEEYIALSRKFQAYKYSGDNTEIKELLVLYVGYGKELETVGKLMKQDKAREAAQKLQDLEELAGTAEMELNRVYEKINQEK